jgi:hypothetical protein
MFKQENRIIIVDDNPSDLKTLSEPFLKNGIGCKCFKYSVDFKTPLTGVRIAFFDIRINPSGGGSDSKHFNDIANAIQQYISKDNGPYALIFWTKNKVEIEGIKTHINDRFPKCPKPFFIDCIDKDEFSTSGKKLTTKLKALLGDETINALFEFEKISSDAASLTIKQLYDIVPKNDTWGESANFKENFSKVFSKVAVHSLGYEHAKKNPDKAVYEALVPMLNHEILSTKSSDIWSQQLTPLALSTKPKDVLNVAGFKNSELNSIFHIDNRGLSTDARGVVLKMNKTGKNIKNAFGLTYSSWIKTFIPFNKEFGQNVADEKTAVINSLIKKSTLIAIEISAACDYQQNRDRLNKYLYGVKMDAIETSLLNKQVPDSSMKIGVFSIGDKEFEIWVNLNYVFGALPTDSRLGKPLFQFKKEMMDQIGNRYANHVSRIGVTSF